MEKRELTPQRWGIRRSASPFFELRDAVDRLLDNWSEDFSLELPRALQEGSGFMTPRINLVETEKEIKVSADLPGLDEKDIQLTISKDHLTLKGEKKEEIEEKGKNFYRKERSFGSFHREIPLPCEVLNDKASAVFRKGVLNITIPKSPQAQQEARQIPIKGD